MKTMLQRVSLGCTVALGSPGVCFAGTQAQTYNFSSLQNLIINIGFVIGAVFFVMGFIVLKQAVYSSGYYKKSTAFFLILSGALLFSVPYITCMLSRSILITTPLDVSGIAINSQLANIQVNGHAGIYSILPPSTIKNIVGLIMLIGWYSIVKALYHIGRAGYTHEKGHVKSFFSHVIAGVLATNIMTVGPWFLGLFSFFPK